MKNRFAYLGAGLLLMTGVALADAGGDMSHPSTTSTGEMEHPASQADDAKPGIRSDAKEVVPNEAGEAKLGTMGAGNRGTTGGMGATTGTKAMNERLGNDEQSDE